MPTDRLIRLDIAYEGTDYCGFQIQPNGPTIQAVLEEAYARLTGVNARLRHASRTDAGVHAAHQVVCFPDVERYDPATWVKAFNSILPEDVVVLAVSQVGSGFDPRGDVIGKRYRYTLFNAPHRPVFGRRFAWHLRDRLDLERLNQGCACLLGEMDFSAFRDSGCESRHAIRTLDRVEWWRDGPWVRLEIFGRAFVKQMVRNVVGTAIEEGRGRRGSGYVAEVLASRDRRRAGRTAPAQGLCLMRIYYDAAEYETDRTRSPAELSQPGFAV